MRGDFEALKILAKRQSWVAKPDSLMVRSAAKRRVSNHGPRAQTAPHRPPRPSRRARFASAPQGEVGTNGGNCGIRPKNANDHEREGAVTSAVTFASRGRQERDLAASQSSDHR